MEHPIIGVDLGGTNIKAGLVSGTGQVLRRLSVPTPPPADGPEAIAHSICEAARQCMDASGATPQEVGGLGIGSPGTIDMAAGIITFSPNLPSMSGFPLLRSVEDEIGLPCALDNDANTAALAEHWIGAGRGADSLVLLTLGTGIGGGIILDGKVWHGGNGAAGEIGHMSIQSDGPLCGCGNRGCLEVLASATAMVRRMRQAIEAGVETSLSSDDLTARDIYEAAVAGDPAARENIETTGRYLGVGVSNIMHVLNPQVIAFSGGVTAAGGMLLDPIREEAQERTMELSRQDVRVCYAELPQDAGIIGAARCFMLR